MFIFRHPAIVTLFLLQTDPHQRRDKLCGPHGKQFGAPWSKPRHTPTYLWFRQGLFDSVEGLPVVSIPVEAHPDQARVQGVDDDLGVSMQELLSGERDEGKKS